MGCPGVVADEERRPLENRRKLTTTIAETALAHAGDGSFLAGSDADAAVFEGRHAAEHTVVRHVQSIAAETTALFILLFVVRPAELPVVVSLVTVAVTGSLLAWQRPRTVTLQRIAWRQYMAVAARTLTSIRAASEIVASGHDQVFMGRLRSSIDDWTTSSARAERNTALFWSTPFAAVVLLGAGLLAHAGSLHIDEVLRLAVLLPPLAGLTRTTFELIRSGPMLATLEPCLDERATGPAASARARRAALPRIRFNRVTFAFGSTPVLAGLLVRLEAGRRHRHPRSQRFRQKHALAARARAYRAERWKRLDWRRRGASHLIDKLAEEHHISSPATLCVPDGFYSHETMHLTLPSLTMSQSRAALILTGAWDHLVRCSAGKVEPLEVAMSQLSVGVRQRVLLARTFAQPANLTLLDEPDENLNQHSRALLMDLLKKLGPSRTIVIATHDKTLLAGTSTVLDLTSSGGRLIRT